MFRVGTTSYILPDDILPNVEYLASRVDDVQLVLFETDEHGSNLPDGALRKQLMALAERHRLTYTVHLPLDLRLGDGGTATDLSLLKARRVIEATRDLQPYAYTAHLDGALLMQNPTAGELATWQANAQHALEVVLGWFDRPEVLCIENIERWDPGAFAPVVEALPVGLTADVGHFWLQGTDPLAYLDRWGDRIRVVHMHGIADRDHASLAHVPADRLDPVVGALQQRFDGVLTLEVFNRDDLESSMEALRTSLGRVRRGAAPRRGTRIHGGARRAERRSLK
jgi:sugar phosphate isomerase/epimerase